MEAVVTTRASWRTAASDYFEMTKPKVQSLLLFTTVTTMYVAGDPSLRFRPERVKVKKSFDSAFALGDKKLCKIRAAASFNTVGNGLNGVGLQNSGAYCLRIHQADVLSRHRCASDACHR